ncbi:MAG: glycosyltransferase [Planctomycetota bacterium]|jgi:glycosyltransferase involved in cell wall biosynthesis
MAKVLIFNNFLKDGNESVLAPSQSSSHQYHSTGPGRWQANPYGKKKHSNMGDLLRRIVSCIKIWLRWRKYDVLIVDSAITGLLVSSLSLLCKGCHKLIISNFNVPRHRKGFWKWLTGMLYRRVDHFFVHSRYDIQISKQLYHLPKERFTYHPFARTAPVQGEPLDIYIFKNKRPFILSFGGNARDYGTFFQAIDGTDLSAIAVAREYNLEGLRIPANVRTFCNIPLEECDKLVSKCLFTVFAFDGSEPSCGQISIVTSFMLGKPTICTDLIGVRDYVTDGVNGLLVEIGDTEDLRAKMLRLAGDKKLYGKLSLGARNWTKENTNAHILQKKVDSLVTRLVS